MRLKGKLVAITGAASGIGRAGCELFAKEGARVAAIDIDRNRLDEVVTSVQAVGGDATGIVADLCDPNACKDSVKEAANRLGGLDILWNNAGTPATTAVENVDTAAYDFAMSLNLRACFLTTSAAIPFLRERNGGSIIFTSSAGGLIGYPLSPIYTASKFGVVGLTKSLAIRYARHNIRVNALCPGPVDTPMFPKFTKAPEDPSVVEAARKGAHQDVPMGRMILPLEVAYAGLFLASDEASMITGAALPIDGGRSAF